MEVANLKLTIEEYNKIIKSYLRPNIYEELYSHTIEIPIDTSQGNNVFVLLGISGAGKTTIAEVLVNNNIVSFLPRITSRERRNNEETGEYIFKDKSYFEDKNNYKTFFTLKKYIGNYYAIENELLLRSLKSKYKFIMIAGLYEGFCLKKTFPNITLIYIKSDIEIANNRILSRRDSEQYYMRRKLHGLDEISEKFSDHIILNKEGQQYNTIKEVENIINL